MVQRGNTAVPVGLTIAAVLAACAQIIGIEDLPELPLDARPDHGSTDSSMADASAPNVVFDASIPDASIDARLLSVGEGCGDYRDFGPAGDGFRLQFESDPAGRIDDQSFDCPNIPATLPDEVFSFIAADADLEIFASIYSDKDAPPGVGLRVTTGTECADATGIRGFCSDDAFGIQASLDAGNRYYFWIEASEPYSLNMSLRKKTTAAHRSNSSPSP